MVNFENDEYVFRGTRVQLGEIWRYVDKMEVLRDMQKNMIDSVEWDGTEHPNDKIVAFLAQDTLISVSCAAKYLKIKQIEKKFISPEAMLEKFNGLKSQMSNFSELLGVILKNISALSRAIQTNQTFIGLEEIAASYKFRGNNLYKVSSLRNKIRVEMIGDEKIGHLKIENVHVTLIKRGKKWVTPKVHWLQEREKLDYDYFCRVLSNPKRRKKICKAQNGL